MKSVIVFLAVVVCAMAMPFDVKGINDKIILDGILCGGCKELVVKAETLSASAVQRYVDGQIDELCSVTSFLTYVCREDVGKVVNQLIADIIKKLSPEDACKDCDMC
uniref:Saposin B-type domain-containing protein n=1 Tax=Plectus sambesii TaxID=2011161 RepID=A0A914V8P7_9BILA